MLTIDQLEAPTPVYDEVAQRCQALEKQLHDAESAADQLATIQAWDQLRRELETWGALVHLRFNQDTTNEAYKKAREYCDELQPRLTDLEVRIKRLLLSSRFRPEIENILAPKRSPCGKRM